MKGEAQIGLLSYCNSRGFFGEMRSDYNALNVGGMVVIHLLQCQLGYYVEQTRGRKENNSRCA